MVDAALEASATSSDWSSICEAIFCSLEGTSHWGNKSLRIELTPTRHEHWPDAKYLVLTRDPRAVLASQTKKFDHSVEYSAMYWNTHAEFIRERIGLRPGEHDDRFIVVDLLEMARDPRPTLDWIFGAVGLSTDPIEELIGRFPGDPARLDNWRSHLDPSHQRRIEEYCFESMQALGYEPELATGPRPIGSVRRMVAMTREHGMELLRDPRAIRRKQVGAPASEADARMGRLTAGGTLTARSMMVTFALTLVPAPPERLTQLRDAR